MTEQLRIDYEALLRKIEADGFSGFTDREERVMSLIPRGKGNATPMGVIAEAIGISSRELQIIIKHLVEDHSILILSSCGSPHGYFLPESVEDFHSGSQQIINRIVSLAKRLRAMDRQKYETIFGQSAMRFDEKL